jgi:hypothetical protein
MDVLQRLRRRQLHRFRYDRGATLARAVRRLARASAPPTYSTLWTDAIYGWANEKWSAEEWYLAEVVRSAERSKGSILECGSGLTTVLIGMVAARLGRQLHALEHNPTWHARVSQAIHDFGANTTTVHLAPLRDYGDFDWYDLPLDSMPNDFTLVVCDGPPAATHGGRSGMYPIMREKLAPGCTVLLDDTKSAAEQELARSWSRASGGTLELHSSERGFARVTL